MYNIPEFSENTRIYLEPTKFFELTSFLGGEEMIDLLLSIDSKSLQKLYQANTLFRRQSKYI